jgi:hypothetical protein
MFSKSQAFQHQGFYGPTGPVTPTTPMTPIIYGNGTMLSDIGEVTEVESTPGKPSPVRNKGLAAYRRAEYVSPTRDSGSDAALRSSPTMGVQGGSIKKRPTQNAAGQHQRRDSIDSVSTVTNDDRRDLFGDFDDSVSAIDDDSVFQGDDEESVADRYVEDALPDNNTNRLGVPAIDSDRLSTHSTSSISRRAEEILANAKKRLTVSTN